MAAEGLPSIMPLESVNELNSKKPKLLGWYVGFGVLMITLGVIFGLVGIFIVAKNKQKYRINQPNQVTPTNSGPRAAMMWNHRLAQSDS